MERRESSPITRYRAGNEPSRAGSSQARRGSVEQPARLGLFEKQAKEAARLDIRLEPAREPGSKWLARARLGGSARS